MARLVVKKTKCKPRAKAPQGKTKKTKDKPTLRLEYRKAGELSANPHNWRKHPKSQVTALNAVLEEVGWAGALLYNERTGRLIDGHLRKEVSGLDDEIPVLVGSWTEDQEKTILATLDPIAAMAEADREALVGLLEAVECEDSQVQALLDQVAKDNRIERPRGDDKADPGAQVDKAAELQEKWSTERGQIWQVGQHRVMCGDSTSDLGRLVDGEKVSVVVTSPPYGVNLEYEKNRPIEVARNVSRVIKELIGVAVDGMIICWNTAHNTPQQTDITAHHHVAFEKAGFVLRDKIAWVKPPGGPSASRRFGVLIQNPRVGMYFPNTRWESIGIFEWGGRMRSDDCLDPASLMGLESDVWALQSAQNQNVHPACYPERLVEPLIRCYASADAIVLDPFLGSGTTLVACEQLGRIGYGMEIEPKYVAVTLERLAGMGLEPRLVT